MTKQRYHNGILLAENLYPDNKGRVDRWRYKNPKTKKWANIPTPMTVEEANQLAEQSNQMIDDGFYDTHIPPAERLSNYIGEYIRYQESLDPSLCNKASWRNRKYAMHKFARQLEGLQMLEMTTIRGGWDQPSYNDQKLRMAAFRYLFN